MEFGLREFLISAGVALIALVLVDAVRRYRRFKRGGLRMDLDLTGSVSGDLFNPELPAGGARPPGAELSDMYAEEDTSLVAANQQSVFRASRTDGAVDESLTVSANVTQISVVGAHRQQMAGTTGTASPGAASLELDSAMAEASAGEQPESLVSSSAGNTQLVGAVDGDNPISSGRSAPSQPRNRAVQARRPSSSNQQVRGKVSGQAVSSRPTSEPEEILILTVLAQSKEKPQAEFHGPEIVRALVACGLRFGAFGAFHLYEPSGSLGERPIISAMNGLKAQPFEMANLQRVRTNALSLFLPIPGPKNPEAAFEKFLTLGDQLSKRLNGRLCDEQKRPLTQVTLEMMLKRLKAVSRSSDDPQEAQGYASEQVARQEGVAAVAEEL